MKKIVSLVLVLCMILPLGSGISFAAPGTPIIEYFMNPDASSKPMARMWFPDASAAVDPDNTVEKQILELGEKGFGGVEFTILSDTGSYNNEEARLYGWGTANWVTLLKMLLNAANKVPGGFQVDVTITGHWPPVLNTIDPNDEAASKETSYTFTKITGNALTSGKLELNLPVKKLYNSKNNAFIFTDDYVAASIARVTGGTGANLQLDFTSIQPITGSVAPIQTAPGVFAGSPAGVPDAATAAAYQATVPAGEQSRWDYAAICEAHGPEPTGSLDYLNGNLVAPGTGKQDANFDRKRLADWQHIYEADLSGLSLTGLNNNAEIAVGDWVVLTTYMRGTGQVMSGGMGKLMHNLTYCTNYFNEAGTKVITDYWDNYILDAELIALMRANGGY
ncbi:MAG: hypothetical protein FWH55_11855, partial [Oscillospiraceae bacterium]|nr:hypothetical protein [Oscillospiraceae bacterium]